MVENASALAKRLRVSDYVIALTVLAMGTSTPELAVNIFASVQGMSGIVIGNILGSNIVNILFILGISAIIYPLKVAPGAVWYEVPLNFLAAILVGVLINDQLIDKAAFSALSRIDGLVLLSFFMVFLLYSFVNARNLGGIDEYVPLKEPSITRIFVMMLVGFIGLGIGSKWVVDSAVVLAHKFNFSSTFVGLTVVAFGTSLPELATSVVAAYKKKPDIAVGNIVGSNIFNVFFILGLSATIRPIPISSFLNVDIIVLIFASLLFLIFMFTGQKRRLDRWEGCVLLAGYLGYIVYLVIRR